MQVFPLIIENFSFQEQASLVWQFICSVPAMVLEEFLPWMMSYLSQEEKTEVENCIKDVVPNEHSLQQVGIRSLFAEICLYIFFLHLMIQKKFLERSYALGFLKTLNLLVWLQQRSSKDFSV